MSRHRVECTVNGALVSAEVEGRCTLLDFLREDLGLVGTHAGCEHGVCGTCTVLLDGRSVRSCLLLAAQVQGSELLTVEGLCAAPGELGPLQQAFWNRQALQCGFCTPGMLLRAHEILSNNPHPSASEVRREISSNLCRCTGYAFIVEAILEAAPAYRDSES